MAFRLFQNENLANGLLANSPTQEGISNQDTPGSPEKGLTLPWLIDAATSWVDYRCWIEVSLDPGIALHKPLPQGTSSQFGGINSTDTLSAGDVMSNSFATLTSGVNLASRGGYADVLQKMATSLYLFTLRGYAVRVGYQIPVPRLVSVAGVPATSAREWTSGNVLVASFGGVPTWACRWELWYYVALPPKQAQTPPPNFAAHIRGDTPLPDEVQVPFSRPDSDSVPQQVPFKDPDGGTGGKGVVGFSVLGS